MGSAGSQYFADALETNSTLTSLKFLTYMYIYNHLLILIFYTHSLSYNHVGPKGAKYLFEALVNNKTLCNLEYELFSIQKYSIQYLYIFLIDSGVVI